MQLLNHLKKRRANGRERHVVFSRNRWKQSGRVSFALLMLGSVLSLGACGGGGNSTSTIPISTATTTIIGSAGDGPVTGGVVSVTDANGATVITVPANPVTNAQAKFNFTVPTSTALPITITVTGGTDIVTGINQDFPLTTAVTTLPAAGTVTGNANPLSTLTVASALAQGGGSLTAANLAAAGNNLLGVMGFGLVAGVDPISTPVNNANIASVVRANESAAELIRRASISTGLGVANTITSIAQDLTDGVVDGNAAAGAMATQVSAINAAHILNQQAQVSAETLANNLNLSTPAGAPLAAASGANFATTLNNAITTIGNTGDVAAEAPSQAFLDQTRRAISVANLLSGGGNAALQSMNANLNALSATITTTAAQHSTLSAAMTTAATAFVTATTAANNQITAAAALAILTDRIAPLAPVITTPVAGSNTTINMLTVSGSAEAGALISLMDGAAYIASATADAAGAWSLSTPAFTLGVHTLTAVANDIAGNTSPASIAIPFTVINVPANSAPTASAVSISMNGIASIGNTLNSSYTYNDVDGDVEGASTYRWLRGGVAIAGATATSYILIAADSGQSISFEVTPVAATGVTLGATVVSTGITVINTAPTITAVSISVNGIASIGNTLNSSYTYNDVDGDVEGTSTYRWLRGGVAITGATATSYILVAADSGQSISFEVTPVAATGVLTGMAVVSAAVVVTGQLSTLSIANASVLEGSGGGATSLNFIVTLSAASTSAVIVGYATADGTALAASDYTAGNATLTIAAGTTTGTITVLVGADTLFEPNETLTLTLSNPVNATITTAVATGTILNDDVGGLNDTGITTWDNGTVNNLTVRQVLFPGQDADYGRDAQAAAGTLVKTGGGRAGFDFTKLDAAGQPLVNQTAVYATTPWSCVQDHVTGLMWEVKTTTPSSLRNKNNTYTWYSSTGINDGGNAGTVAISPACNIGGRCDTEKYVAAVNALTGVNRLCGFTDWRLPKTGELYSIMDQGIVFPGPIVDTAYFSNTIGKVYWSTSPYPGGAAYAWGVDFGGGYDSSDLKTANYYVRLVRGGF